ncbi:MAG: phosphoribosyl-AMP cyclohydrolase, partial [Deltaproteobacteria bacterium CG12_big_fil_rev_8_21_14_0_65_43_10]
MIELDFEKGGGLVPVIVQDNETEEVLMLAYMNREA